MAYIGKTPVLGNFVKLDAISVVNGQAAYTMQNGGVNFTSYDNVNQFLVSLNGILQSPTDSFTVSGSTLTFASNLSTGDVIDFVMVLGNTLDVGTPSDNTVTTAKIGANAVTGAKLNNDVISAQTALTSEPADTDEFLVSDAGTLKRIDYSLIKGGGITEADQWRLTAGFAPNSNSTVFITSNLERADTDGAGYIGTGMSQSSGIFTFPSTGYYLITAFGVVQGDAQYMVLETHTTTDNSTYNLAARAWSWGTSTDSYHTSSHCFLFDVTNTSTHKVKFGGYREGSSSHVNFNGDTSQSLTSFNFLRLGDT